VDTRGRLRGPTIYPEGALCCPGSPHQSRGLCSSCYQQWRAVERGRPVRDVDHVRRLQGIVAGHEDRKAAAKRSSQKARRERANAKRRLHYKGWREKTLWYRYGLTLDDYNQMLRRQNGACAICKKPQEETRLYVDHCHTTHHVRALLCPKCNTTVGQLETMTGQEVGALLAYIAEGGPNDGQG